MVLTLATPVLRDTLQELAELFTLKKGFTYTNRVLLFAACRAVPTLETRWVTLAALNLSTLKGTS